MIRSLYSGVSGMRSNQTKMDTVGNNIANVNTTGFKAGRVRFQDMLSQTLASAQAPTENTVGGVNAQQIGLGVKVGSVDTIMTGGALQPTNRDLDFAIEGEGFFVVSQDKAGDMKLYTRDGAFYRDYEGGLVNSGGYRVLGYKPDAPDTLVPLDISNKFLVSEPDEFVDLESYAIDGNGKITGVYSDGKSRELGQMAVSKFQNTEGLEKVGSSNYRASNNSGEAIFGTANSKGYGAIKSSVLEMSNVDLADEFTELIVTSRSYQANSKTITTSDEMLQELINLKR